MVAAETAEAGDIMQTHAPPTRPLWCCLITRTVQTRSAEAKSAKAQAAIDSKVAQAKALPEEIKTTVENAVSEDDDRLLVSLGDDLRDLALAHRPDTLADASPGELLVWMLDSDCKRQALTLIGRVHAGQPLD